MHHALLFKKKKKSPPQKNKLKYFASRDRWDFPLWICQEKKSLGVIKVKRRVLLGLPANSFNTALLPCKLKLFLKKNIKKIKMNEASIKEAASVLRVKIVPRHRKNDSAARCSSLPLET